MTYEPKLIAPYGSGLSLYYKPFLIGNDAFTDLNNCYSWRGRIKKREGSNVLGQLAQWATVLTISDTTPPIVTTTAPHGLLTGDMVYLDNVQNSTIIAMTTGLTTLVTTNIAHGLSVGYFIQIFGVLGTAGAIINGPVVKVVGVPAANQLNLLIDTTGTVYGGAGTIFLPGINNTAHLITVTGAATFTLQNLDTGVNLLAQGPALSGRVFLPVVGLWQYIQQATGNQLLVAFHPKKAFVYNTGTGLFQDISFNTAAAPILWSGTKDDFFYASNYASTLWATNNVDEIRFWNGAFANGWAINGVGANLGPVVRPGFVLRTALIILPYKGRLVALNVTEFNGVNDVGPFYQRAAWSQIGTPYVNNAPAGYSNDADAWRQDITGRGGFIDADTNDRIVSAEIIQDTLIVGFQFSTWRLRYTGNELLPFVWERINTQYGSEATFSAVPFDDAVLMISRRGIIASSFNDVDRIDLDIPDLVNTIETGTIGEGFQRIQGVRDYQKRLVYWIYGEAYDNVQGGNQTPNKILCFNYEDKTWSTFSQSFTCLGTYKITQDNTWNTWVTIWAGDNTTWNTALDESNTILTVAGDVQSRVWSIMEPGISTDAGVVYNFTITTNLINPYFKVGSKCRLAYYDLYLTSTDAGKAIVKNYIDDDDSDPWAIRIVNFTEADVNATYFRVFLGMIARNHQITITLSDDQMADQSIASSDFELQGVVFWTRREGRVKR